MADSKTCFVISPIGEPDSEIRERSNQMLRHVIRPSVESQGYEAVRADEIAEPGIITSQVIEHVVESPLVIADLTGSNANVFYELAVRHASQKPIIQLIQRGESIPFDVAGTRTIQIDLSDLDSVEEAKNAIQSQIESIESEDKDLETPISVALDLKVLRESTDPEERSLADLMETLSELRTNMVAVQNKLENPEEILPPSYFRSITQSMNVNEKEEFEVDIRMLRHRFRNLFQLMKEHESVDETAIESEQENIEKLLQTIEHKLSEPTKVPTSSELADFDSS